MDESMEIQMTPAELADFIKNHFPQNTPSAPPGTQPIGPLITVADRCRDRWPEATKKNQRRIRDAFMSIHHEKLDRRPFKLTGYVNGTIVVEQEHVSLLDLAIDRVRADVLAKESRRKEPTLF